MKKLILYISTINKLGFRNVAYVAWYRLSLKTGFRKHWFKQKEFKSKANFFKESKVKTDYPAEWKKKLINDAHKVIKGELRYFAYHWKQVGNPPNWFLNPFNGTEYPETYKHWCNLPDFNPAVGDIKNVWEASRFEWVVTLSRAYAVTGDKTYLDNINAWLSDWAEKNPLNTGPHWKCGQEASIRLFNLLNASYILNQYESPSEALTEFVYATLQRISKNIRYAIAQDNNHGTSEAAGLFIGGLWLQKVAQGKFRKAKAYANKGRYWLGNRVKKLITDSGSFSQHSVTYHRVMLDTLCFAEFWRRTFNAKPFSNHFNRKAKAASYWLYKLTDKVSGNAPNMGSNDGALFLNIHSCEYRNFKPSLQLAANLFFDASWFDEGLHNEPLFWFSLNQSVQIDPPPYKSFSAHGYATLHGKDTWALIKWPYFKFRPSHNDVLHVDVWYKGKNVLCDSGSYSYNPEREFQHDLKSVHFHNTVSFDNHEQMPKLSRFLMANWLKVETASLKDKENNNAPKWVGSYTNTFGDKHHREVELCNNQWIITDKLSGRFKKAVIGFNINSNECYFKSNLMSTPLFTIKPPKNANSELKEIWVSQYYQEKHIVRRLEITVFNPGTYETIITLV